MSRPGVALEVYVLSLRVREHTIDDWQKLNCLVDYIKDTRNLHLILCIDGTIPVSKWFVDASFAVHPDVCSHIGEILKMAEAGGTIILSSTKQRIISAQVQRRNWSEPME